MKNKIYLHIGSPKTGTTTIQHFLRKNDFLLRKSGLFPCDFWNQFGEYGGIVELVKNWENEDSVQKRLWKDYIGKINKAISEGYSVIISEEGLWDIDKRFLLVEELIRQFDVILIIYLRRQDTYIETSWNQLIKQTNKFNMDFSDFVTNVLSKKDELMEDTMSRYYTFDYKYNIEKFANLVGKENILIRVFEKDQFVNRDLIHDFLEIFGIDDIDQFARVENVNFRLNGKMIQIKRELDDRFSDNRVRKIIRKVMEEKNGEYLVNHPECTDEGYFTLEERKKILLLYKKDNEFIAQKYLNRQNGELFREEISDKFLYDEKISQQEEFIISIFVEMIGELTKEM